MNEQTLLTYGVNELAAFRADMAAMADIDWPHKTTAQTAVRVLRDVLRNADARRKAAGLTRTEAERACVLAATVERHAR